ncbi:hypothetical protein LCGC14_2954950, partial [marine sediment metagenome]
AGILTGSVTSLPSWQSGFESLYPLHVLNIAASVAISNNPG